MKRNEEIIDAVDHLAEKSLKFLQELVKTPSLEGDEKNCQLIINEKFHSMGLTVDMWDLPDEELKKHPAYVPTDYTYKNRPNVSGKLEGTGGGKSLMFLGHVDVVPTGPEETWELSPWSGEYIDGKVYGRGSCDMKGGLVSMILAIESLQKLGLKMKGEVYLHSIIDEEVGGNGTLACLLRGYRADACVQPEPSGLKRISISGRGAQFFRIIVPGQSGGTEYKHSLINPITKGLEVFQAVEAFSIMRESETSHPLYESITTDDRSGTKVPTGICKFHAGEWPSTVAEQAVLEGTLECLPNEDIHEIKSRFKSYIEEWSRKDSWFKDNPLILEWFGLWFESAEIEKNHPLVKVLESSTNSVTGEKPNIMGGGGSDLRLPIIYADTPTVLFGPSGGLIHSSNEYVNFSEVIDCAKILALLTVDWCGVSES